MDVSFLKANNGPFCRLSSPRPHSTSSSPPLKNPLRRSICPSTQFLKIPSWRSFAARHSDGALHVSANFRRPARRRNSLREKLTVPRDDQVRELSNPDPNSKNSTHSHDSVEKSNLWHKLENWVDRYKEDSDFWGIGTGPIFTVYQDSNGNVNRASVNLDEITKRSRVPAPSSSKERKIIDLDTKISRAKVIAKEIETGEYRIPTNSSIAKFVVEGKKSSVVDGGGIRSAPLKGEMFMKLYPRIGFTVLCGYFAFWAVKKMFVVPNKPELTREEAEMLRRKKKSRMTKEATEKGRVEIVQDAPELPMISNSRPKLDKDELMRNIVQAKGSRDSLLVSDSPDLNANSHDFVDKVREIRQMARKARESERQDHPEIDKKGKADDLSSALLPAGGKDATFNSNAYLGVEPVNNEPVLDILSQTDSPLDHAVVTGSKEALIKNNTGDGNSTRDCESQNNSGMNDNFITVNVDDTRESKTGRDVSIGVGSGSVADREASSDDVSINKDEVGSNEIATTILKGPNTISTGGTISVKMKKPKIIRSVKEAREYLAEKRRTTTKIQTNKKSQSKSLARGNNLDDNLNKSNSMTDTNTKVIEPSKLNRPQDDATSSNKFTVKTEDIKARGEKHGDLQHSLDGRSKDPVSANRVLPSSFLDNSETGEAVNSRDILHGSYIGNTVSLDQSGVSTSNYSNDEKGSLWNQTATDSCTDYKQQMQSPEASSSSTNSAGVASAKKVPPIEDDLYHDQFDVSASKGDSSHDAPIRRLQDSIDLSYTTRDEPNVSKDWTVRAKGEVEESSEPCIKPTLLAVDSSKKPNWNGDDHPSFSVSVNISEDSEPPFHNTASISSEEHHEIKGVFRSETSFSTDSAESLPVNAESTWVERNFDKFDPIIKKIGVGFRGNYMVAKEKVQEQPSLSPEISELGLMEDDGELEWMTDESLRDIVFQVRENELAGRDPFYLMDAGDQQAFFEGLERKTEKMNEKLSGLHELVHSRIENLDYGADGISLYDPLEKIIPRWKGPSIGKNPEFLGKSTTGNGGNSLTVKDDTENSIRKPKGSPNSNYVSPYSPISGSRNMTPSGAPKNPKTLIESSDGLSRPGKKTGKEHWQHTKKWSRGFLEVYNSETDPEMKSIMKDMGKDLDKWITEKEVQDVADLMTKIPKRKRRYIEKKMDKLKREVKAFGAQAVVSKYREYADEKEEDYLWWLDLPYVLCIELYTTEDDKAKIGFYSLEMAADLELDPKQYHVIAFEDPGDAKNLCYIMQGHMDILGNGRAFVVARPPKDAFREARANEFSVTVIRKGEVKLNVDLTLEEVEDEIKEIGSKIYHDKIMRERGVDIRAIMKGVVSSDKSTKRTSKRKRVKSAKS